MVNSTSAKHKKPGKQSAGHGPLQNPKTVWTAPPPAPIQNHNLPKQKTSIHSNQAQTHPPNHNHMTFGSLTSVAKSVRGGAHHPGSDPHDILPPNSGHHGQDHERLDLGHRRRSSLNRSVKQSSVAGKGIPVQSNNFHQSPSDHNQHPRPIAVLPHSSPPVVHSPGSNFQNSKHQLAPVKSGHSRGVGGKSSMSLKNHSMHNNLKRPKRPRQKKVRKVNAENLEVEMPSSSVFTEDSSSTLDRPPVIVPEVEVDEPMQCPRCLVEVRPIVRGEPSRMTHFISLILCLVCLTPLMHIPYWCNCRTTPVKRCPKCGAYLTEPPLRVQCTREPKEEEDE